MHLELFLTCDLYVYFHLWNPVLLLCCVFGMLQVIMLVGNDWTGSFVVRIKAWWALRSSGFRLQFEAWISLLLKLGHVYLPVFLLHISCLIWEFLCPIQTQEYFGRNLCCLLWLWISDADIIEGRMITGLFYKWLEDHSL